MEKATIKEKEAGEEPKYFLVQGKMTAISTIPIKEYVEMVYVPYLDDEEEKTCHILNEIAYRPTKEQFYDGIDHWDEDVDIIEVTKEQYLKSKKKEK